MRKLKVDLTGQRFGKLTVIEMLPNYKGNHKVFCSCKCDCGNCVIKRADNLTKSKHASCGCESSQPKENLRTRKNYVGQKFGHLTVTKMLYGYGKSRDAYCECVCDCGNKHICSAYSLKTKQTPPHCGCMKQHYKNIQSDKCRKDYTGLRFGKLIVDHMEYKRNGTTYAWCTCDCGSMVRIRATELTRKDGKATQSCGCLQSERASLANTKDISGHVFMNGVKALRPSHQNKNGVWMWVFECPLCHSEFIALPAKVQNNHTSSCGCGKQSSGEQLVSSILDDMGIDYEAEYKFQDCKNLHPLRFDFYIEEFNTAIEYQGAQHYRPVEIFGGDDSFERQCINDNMKREYCNAHSISLIEIPYTLKYTEIFDLLQTSFIRRDCNG